MRTEVVLRIVTPRELTAEAWAPFGAVLSAEGVGAVANQGTAHRFDGLTRLVGTRPAASWNVCVFRCSPRLDWPLVVDSLERHPHSNQVFCPMDAVAYLLVVAQGETRPDPATVRAFVAAPGQAIDYRMGTWHHPMIALERHTDFLCLVHEEGSAGDCEVAALDGVAVAQPGYLAPTVR